MGLTMKAALLSILVGLGCSPGGHQPATPSSDAPISASDAGSIDGAADPAVDATPADAQIDAPADAPDDAPDDAPVDGPPVDASLCGNGVVDAPEECDFAVLNAGTTCGSNCTLLRAGAWFSRTVDPTYSAMSFNKYGPNGGFECDTAVTYTCSDHRPSRSDSALAFCDCLDNIADASGKAILSSAGGCPHDSAADFWTSGGGFVRLATLAEVLAGYSGGIMTMNDLVTGDYVWSCTEAGATVAPQGADYGVMTMRHTGAAATSEGEVYCGYSSYTQHFAMCVGVDYVSGS
jgi:hypothetical protein